MARVLGVPRLLGIAVVSILAWSLRDVNRIIASSGGVPTSEVVRAGNLAAFAMLASVPVVAAAVWHAWRGLPASRVVKRRSLRRSSALQVATVLVGLLLAIGTRRSAHAVEARATREDGRLGYLGRWEWGCATRLESASDAMPCLILLSVRV